MTGPRGLAITVADSSRGRNVTEVAASRGELRFLDWEPNVLGDRGPDAPYAGSKALHQAALAASKTSPKAEAADLPAGGASEAVKKRFDDDEQKIRAYYDKRDDTSNERYYVFDAEQKPIAGPVGEARRSPAGGSVLKVPRGIAVIEAERAPNQPETVRRVFVVEDDSELSGSDIKNPAQSSDRQTQEPIVTMEFTDEGRKAFAEVTKRLARRGSEVVLPPGTNRETAQQRFAIALDGKVVSLATIDFRENPEGIDGRTGAQINGIGTVQETRDLAASLRTGPLPVELELLGEKRG